MTTDAPPRPLRLPLAVAGLVLVLATAVTGWYVASAAAARDVVVTATPRCPQAEFEDRPVGVDDRRVSALVMRPGTRCRHRIQVTNTGSMPVRLDRAVLSLLGPEGGAVVRADVRGSARSGLDAVVDLDRRLEPGESTAFGVDIVHRPEGCSAGGTGWTDRWPEVEVSGLGRSVTVRGSGVFAFRQDGWTPGCRDMR